MFAPVSRAAVYKRLTEGRLTAFSFHVRKYSKTLFGRERMERETPFVFIPVSECKAWGEEIRERMAKRDGITTEELEGPRPDWVGDFWEWRSKWRKTHNPREDDR